MQQEQQGLKNIHDQLVGGGPWLRVDGQTAKISGGDAYQIEKSPNHAGTFYNNNGVIVAHGPEGEVFVTADTTASRDALRRARMGSKSAFVPLSNGETLEDTGLKEAFSNIRAFGKSAEDRIFTSASYVVSGRSYTRLGSDNIEKVPDHAKGAGRYNIAPTGMIAFVDTQGKTRIGSDHLSNGYVMSLEERLNQHGYQKDETLYVPFGQGEIPMHENDAGHMVEDKHFQLILNRFKDTPAYRRGMKNLETGWARALEGHDAAYTQGRLFT
jgi:hypothetical protein